MKGRKPTRLHTGKIDIGSEIKNRLKTSKHSVVWFAGQLECSRTNVYKIFEKQTISTEELFRISEILGCDFFKMYSDKLSNKKYSQW
jgi:hypothetical protein